MDSPAHVSRRLKVAIVLAVLSVLPVAAAQVSSQGRQPSAKDLDCQPQQRAQAFAREQGTVLGRLGGLAVLRDRGDLARLAGPSHNFSALVHQFTSIAGLGLTISNPAAQIAPGSPNVLFYAPSKDARSTKDPRGPDFPYTLTGWAYDVAYTPGRLPSFLQCVGAEDWHVHERGIHPYKTGGMIAMPPAEAGFGESAGLLSDPPALRPVVGYAHPRTWQAHFWRGGGTPESAILDPADPAAGINAGEGSSLYFLEQPPTGVLEPGANALGPTALQPGEGPRRVVGGSTLTLKAAATQSGGAFSVFEVAFRRDGQLSRAPVATGVFVLSGRMTFTVAGQRLPARGGSFVYVPPGSAARFTVEGGRPAQALLATVPGGAEEGLGFSVPPGPPGGRRPPRGGGAAGATRPFVLQPGEGEVVRINNGTYTLKAKAEDTGGAFTLMTIRLPRGSAPGPHIHHSEAEAFFITAGELTFQSGGLSIPAQPGTFLALPRALPHVYAVDSDEAELILLAVPAGLEDFFRQIGRSGPPSAAQALKFGVEPVIPPSQQRR